MSEQLQEKIKATPGNLWLLKEQYDISKEIPIGMDYDAYFKVMMACAGADGVLAEEEKKWVIGYADALGAPQSTIEEFQNLDGPIDINVKKMLSKSEAAYMTRRFLIYYAIQACSADGDFNEGERKAINQAAEALGISLDRVKQIEKMVHAEKALREKRLAFLYPEGPPY